MTVPLVDVALPLVDVGVADIHWAALAPALLLLLAFLVYCLVDLYRSPVRYLPKWIWAVLCLISIPLGGIVYLLVGRSPDREPTR